MHANSVKTLLGTATFNALGDWTERRVLMTQFQASRAMTSNSSVSPAGR